MTRIRGRLQRLERRFGNVGIIRKGELLPAPAVIAALRDLEDDLGDPSAEGFPSSEDRKKIIAWFENHGYSFEAGYWDD